MCALENNDLDFYLLARVIETIRVQGAFLSVAESLTGGLLAATFVNVPGISDIFRGGVVSYTNEIKARILGVDAQLLAAGGAVQAEVARQMAQGVANLYCTDYALATTGVAGPGSAEGKPQGTVFIGLLTPAGVNSVQYHFSGNREQIRGATVAAAISLLATQILP